MADYFIEYAESYLVTPEQARTAEEIFKVINYVYDHMDEDLPEEIDKVYQSLSDDLQAAIGDFGVGFTMSIEEDEGKPYLYVASDEGSSVDTVLYFLSDVLEATDDHTVWTLTWSAGCSKQRSGEFGGGAAAISMTHVEAKNVWTVAEELHEKMMEVGA